MAQDADATLGMTKSSLDAVTLAPNDRCPNMTPEQAFDAATASSAIQVAGNKQKVHE